MAEYDKVNETDSRENPTKSANIFSILTFSWMNKTLGTGNKRPLDNSDLLPLLDEHKTRELTDTLEQAWADESHPYPGERTGRELFWALLRVFHWTEHVFLLCTGFINSSCIVLQPVFLSMLLFNLMGQSTQDSWMAYVWGAAICISSLFRVVAYNQFSFKAYTMSMRWKAATTGLIYRKVRRVVIARATGPLLSSSAQPPANLLHLFPPNHSTYAKQNFP